MGSQVTPSNTAAATAAKRVEQTLANLSLKPNIYQTVVSDHKNSPPVPAHKNKSFGWDYSDHGAGLPVGTPIAKSNEGKQAPALFQPLTIRNMTLKNRIITSPMCQYSSEDGYFNNWHLVNAGSFAVGGVAAVTLEATAVSWEGRISQYDTGLWKDEHITKLKEIVDFVHSQNAYCGIQLAHAGRKASDPPLYWNTKNRGAYTNITTPVEGGWPDAVVGPSAIPWSDSYVTPHELTVDEIKIIVQKWRDAAIRAGQAGLDFIEIHAAHGYLLSSFLSPISNQRTDEYGGSIENRTRLFFEIISVIREVWSKALFVRISSTEHAQDTKGWDLQDTLWVAERLHAAGVDLLDCSSGGNYSKQKLENIREGYQVQYAEAVKKHVPANTLLSGAVGLIQNPQYANTVIEQQQADVVFIARQLLREPRWPLRAAAELHWDITWAPQYMRVAKPKVMFSIP